MSVRPLLRSLLVTLALLAGFVTLVPWTAQAAGTGALTGTVRDADGPLTDVLVSAYRFEDDGSWSWAGDATTGANGGYTIADLDPGSYFLQYEDLVGDHPSIYSPGSENPPESADSAGVYTVTSTAVPVPVVTMPQAPDSTLEGLVHTTEGTKIDNVMVQAFPVGSSSDGEPTASDITYGGHYALWVAPGQYRIEFTDLSGRYADHVTESATAVKDETTTLDPVELEEATSFVTATGRVNLPAGISASDVLVTLHRFTTTPDRPSFDTFAVDTTSVDPTGAYAFTKVMPGKRYSIEVTGLPLHPRWLGNTDDVTEADSFVAQTNTTLSSITVSARPTVSGRVTDSAGNAAGVSVTVLQWNGDFWDPAEGEAVTDASGMYRVPLPDAGRYTLYFDTYGTSSPGRDAYLNGSTAQPLGINDAGAFSVTSAQQLTGKNVTLPNSTRLSGTVTYAGSPAQGVKVTAYTWDSEFEDGWSPVGFATTDSSGNYFMRIDSPGRYTVSYDAPRTSPAASQWLGNLDQAPATQSSTGTFAPTQGAVIDRDITLPTAPVATGQVLSSAGGPVPGARVRSYVWSGADNSYWQWYGYAVADQSGHYSVKVARKGEATFRAAGTGHYRAFLGGSTRLPDEPTSANSVHLAGAAVTVPNITLAARPTTKGSISGTVTAASNGAPVKDAEVIACPVLGGACQYTTTNASGGYTFADVVTGPWSVRVWPPSESLFSGGTSVTVKDSETATGNVALKAPAPLPGGVTVAQQGHTTSAGIPTVYIGSPLTLTAPGPERSPAPTYTVKLADGGILAQGSLGWSTAQQQYKATISSLNEGGQALVTINGLQGGPVSFNLYIDPSGVVVDQYGVPVPASKATLLRSETQNGTYTAVPDGSDTMSPSNRANPMTTDDDARFHWDVTDGWYKIRAEHVGCTTGTSPALQVPPVRADLMVELVCTGHDPNVAAPSVSGTGKVGQNLTLTPGRWAAGLSQKTYQWYRGAAPIVGATGTTYTVQPGDVGKSLSVRETAARPDYVTENGTGAPVTFTPATKPSSNSVTGTLGASPTSSVAPKISGTRAVGKTLSASSGTWTPTGFAFSYQWTRNGVAISKATSATYRVATADAARSLAVRVTATRPGYATATATSSKVTIAKVASTTGIRLVATKVKKAKHGQAVMTVRSAGLVPTGLVTVVVDRRFKAHGTLTTARHGVIKVVLPKLAKGHHLVRATYAGASQISRSTSRAVSLTVVK